MKTKIVSGRGTSAREVEFHKLYWQDNLFNGYSARKLATLPPEMILSIKRGTARVKASKYPKVHGKVLGKGFVISIARGTGVRIL